MADNVATTLPAARTLRGKDLVERARLEQQQATILREVIQSQTLEQKTAGATLPGDRARLRGLPALGKGTSSTMPGAQPELNTSDA